MVGECEGWGFVRVSRVQGWEFREFGRRAEKCLMKDGWEVQGREGEESGDERLVGGYEEGLVGGDEEGLVEGGVDEETEDGGEVGDASDAGTVVESEGVEDEGDENELQEEDEDESDEDDGEADELQEEDEDKLEPWPGLEPFPEDVVGDMEKLELEKPEE
jgi:hypothetical protein